ncbi:type II toxin-antitoxin system HicB family antitoxin [Paracraurococcus lichenis]|uniref:Type II toxin-antitoxin system HicB family antitoxin n=1 Tax=Paracraurococcus lichenis TaxID=3064888 RepID=A0ABT9E8F2_9PROT|nr:type II toxin-antitoxin system HicB family antitoxin [Paracraurococcus sp. LOR1-02]MDO9712465.1 type II toxin-antitoxin system HicB family antitoxin [Paracraurococcus sp. LOR1-02]
MRYAYPAEVEEAADGVTVTFPDVPGAVGCGPDRTQALASGADALASILAAMVDDGEVVPVPSSADGRPMVAVSALEAAKLALNAAMAKRGISNVELAKSLGCDEKAVRRLRGVLHVSRMPEVERALAALGMSLVVEVEAVDA